MAQGTKQARNDQMQRRDQGMERRNRGTFDRGGFSQWDPFTLMNSFRQEMDRFMDDLGFGGNFLSPSMTGFGGGQMANWTPTTEIFERDNELVVRADLPGLTKDDIDLDIDDDQITIRGERKSEHEENREGFFRSERSYGRFIRSIPIPQGIDPEQAKANFRNGVLEITMPKPERPRGRKLEIEENNNR
jgi:HSP20 family protein